MIQVINARIKHMHKCLIIVGNYHLIEETNKPKKTSWPELVGVGAEEAMKKIKEDMPEAKIHVVLPPIYAITQDFVPNRVWLLIDRSHKVWQTPSIG